MRLETVRLPKPPPSERFGGERMTPAGVAPSVPATTASLPALRFAQPKAQSFACLRYRA